jgi:hypothetical protein
MDGGAHVWPPIRALSDRVSVVPLSELAGLGGLFPLPSAAYFQLYMIHLFPVKLSIHATRIKS